MTCAFNHVEPTIKGDIASQLGKPSHPRGQVCWDAPSHWRHWILRSGDDIAMQGP